MKDQAKTVVDVVSPAIEVPEVHLEGKGVHPSEGLGLKPQVRSGQDVALSAEEYDPQRWMIDGGASCHVIGYDPGPVLTNRKRVSIDILVGGGHILKCSCTGDLTLTPCLDTRAQKRPTANPEIKLCFQSPEWIKRDGKSQSGLVCSL